MNELETFMFKAATQELVDALVAAEPGPAAEDALFGLFAEYMVQNYSAELQTYRCATPSAMGHYIRCMHMCAACAACMACICS